METLKYIMSDAHGIYIPKNFVELFEWEGIDPKDREILLDGPDHLDYWEAWDSVLESAFYQEKINGNDGYRWTLHQDGDLFAVRSDHQWEDECEDEKD